MKQVNVKKLILPNIPYEAGKGIARNLRIVM